ncbi:MAG: nickel pincer cofactor biosynthesis protein LarC [Bacillota bacterium]|nr:nickel pincer cofactor biosynthesis protein LarC [Bacillota bacterium]
MYNSEARNGITIYFDCYSGISGDMVLGTLLDLGLELNRLQKMLDGLKLPGYRLESEKISRGGIQGTRAKVILEDQKPVMRNLPEILSLIDKADLPQPVRENSTAVFNNLALAEAKVHGISVEKVHFHEVGAIDAIVDIVGASCAFYLLEVEHIFCSPLPTGRGEVKTAHGKLPLPAPATLELLALRNVPIRGSEAEFELVTPTGAAIITTFAEAFGPIPALTLELVGYGAGSHDPGYPNYLRTLMGTAAGKVIGYDEEVLLLETNIDDLNPEIYGYLMKKLFTAGALDVYYTPIQMKKNRPAVKITVLTSPDMANIISDLLFLETTTLGVRLTYGRKIMKHRETAVVETDWGPIRIKYVPQGDNAIPVHYAPEFDDCQAVAEKSTLPLKEIYRLAESLFRSGYRK